MNVTWQLPFEQTRGSVADGEVLLTLMVTVSAVRSVNVAVTPALLFAGMVIGLLSHVALPVVLSVTLTFSVATDEQVASIQALIVTFSLVQVRASPSVVISI